MTRKARAAPSSAPTARARGLPPPQRVLCIGGPCAGRHVELSEPSRYWSFYKPGAPPRPWETDPEDALDHRRVIYERHVFYDTAGTMITTLVPVGWSGAKALLELLSRYRPELVS